MARTNRASDFPDQSQLDRIHEIVNDCLVRRSTGEMITDESIIAAHPHLMPHLGEWLRGLHLLENAGLHWIKMTEEDDQQAGQDAGPDRDEQRRCPSCDTFIKIDGDTSLVACSSCGSPLRVVSDASSSSNLGLTPFLLDSAAAEFPTRIGRYRIEKPLGQGAFGRVFLAHDDQLGRPVAVKVPHGRLVSRRDQAETYLSEARTVANLDHAHIVPVHDVGSTDDFPCYIVCKYIEGTDLATKLKETRLTYTEALELVATVADALHYAHKQGLVHRDVKPGNILIGRDGRPYVVDFGLALREENIGSGARYAGTPAYMSPEQARGEGHRVDGRSDVFSLGIVLYELLVGRRPFRGETRAELLEQLANHDPRPMRQYNDQIPQEVERICRQAMAKRAADRYFTARDFAEDLRQFSAAHEPSEDLITRDAVQSVAPDSKAQGSGTSEDSPPLQVVPKGLRSFDAHDADFFMELLPGARDRNGLPDSIRFWKTRIEETDSDSTFSVGLIYGPSGCGKSSLMKAGLLPRLSEDVIPVYIEATREETEARLLRALRRRCDTLEDDLSLPQTLAVLRTRQGVSDGKKVLIVLDQFEQWLHGKTEQRYGELVHALRQCDGGRVQCILMVRDDFWMAVTRFLREMEVLLLQDHNLAAVDLFPERHARNVLAAFGRAYGVLPGAADAPSKPQLEFLKRSVVGLADEGKVICVRLALFAEMMKGKSWTPASLKAMGGTEGVGERFLEETFCSHTAAPNHRYHQKAARAVLMALLPDAGTDIRGHIRPYDELRQVSGYARRPHDFDDLMKILDSDVRLITPTDPERVDVGDDSLPSAEDGQNYYQLTHDYMVHSLRQWLTHKKKETHRGRAELCLAERSARWTRTPENRQLPSLREYLGISALTAKKNWSQTQRAMMHQAGRLHGIRCGGLLILMFIAGMVMQHALATVRSQLVEKAVASLRNARGPTVPYAIRDLEEFPAEMVQAELSERFASHEESRKLPLAFALAHFGDVRVPFLLEQIQNASSDEADNFVRALSKSADAALPAIRHAADAADSRFDWPHKHRLAMVELCLGGDSVAKHMCRIEGRKDPIQRTMFIEQTRSWHADLARLATLADKFEDSALRYGLCLGIGGIAADRLPTEAREAWQARFVEWHQNKPDSSTHSAAGLVLRRWGVALDDKPSPAPVAELPVEMEQRLAKLAENVSRVARQRAERGQGDEDRQQAWEEQLATEALPSTKLSEGLVYHISFEELLQTGHVLNAARPSDVAIVLGDSQAEQAPGITGHALRLRGDSYISLGHRFQPDQNDAFSYGGWFRTSASGKTVALISKYDDGSLGRGFNVLLHQGSIEVHLAHQWHREPYNAIKVTVPRDLTDGQWHHVFVVYDGSAKASGVMVFVDGAAMETEIVADHLDGTIRYTSGPLYLGRLSSVSRKRRPFFEGLLDDVRIYNRALTAEEVAELVDRADELTANSTRASRIQPIVRTLPKEARTAYQNELIESYYSLQDENSKKLRAAFGDFNQARNDAQILVHGKLSRRWYVNQVGITMLVVPSDRPDDHGSAALPPLPLSFAVSDLEISRKLFLRFVDETKRDWGGRHDGNSAHPVTHVSWYDAAQFCNWLSEKDRLSRCYEPSSETFTYVYDSRKYRKWNYNPSADGYRLPTNWEWNHICQAGTTTAYASGDDDRHLRDYAVYEAESTMACGSRLPNAWGLFDLYGNVWEWCGDDIGRDPIMRGGSFVDRVSEGPSAYRSSGQPNYRDHSVGFRVARTLLHDKSLLVLDGIDEMKTSLQIAGFVSGTQAAQGAGPPNETMNNLRELVLATVNYESDFGRFPAAYNVDQDGKPLLSWRVHVLPFLGHGDLYGQFRLDEPWNSEHNRKLIMKMPDVYRAPSAQLDPGKTSCLAVRGQSGILMPPEQADGDPNNPSPGGIHLSQVTDGTSKTIVVVEASEHLAVIWTKPDDFDPDPDNPIKGLIGLRDGGFLAGFCDADVVLLSKKIPKSALKALFTRNGGEKVPPY